MQLLCPDCQTAFAGATHCPKCGGRLISPQEAHLLRKIRKTPAPAAVEPTTKTVARPAAHFESATAAATRSVMSCASP